MVSIKQFAEAYEKKRMNNIADLEVVNTDIDIQTEVRLDMDNKEYQVSFIVVDGKEYRVPNIALEQLKAILETNPDLKNFKVNKTGQGMATKYQVIPIV
ncbi:MAG: hypothetical protein CMC55_00125 [Flavobacteriaceae bacterium]|nr:hypothetical protein [Flavobacteriaceae bacterium]|tara:strand:+ start:540 stop:836 length:297 start_codon:yes stop_codon:yes gene_type:complete